MGMLEQTRQAETAERAFSQALNLKRQLGEFGLESKGYVEALHAIVHLCQDALAADECHGDAQVLLAEAFYLLHRKIHPTTGNDLPLRLAAATIQHWSDRRLCPDSSTQDAGLGCRVHGRIASALAELCLDCGEREEREMRYLEGELYATALMTEPSAWMAVWGWPP